MSAPRRKPTKQRKRPKPTKTKPKTKDAGRGPSFARSPRVKAVWQGTKGQLVTLSGPINQSCVRKLARVFENYDGPVTIALSTPGGDLDAAMAMHELIRLRVASGRVVMTLGVGVVMSAGVLLLCAGSKGHRVMTRFTRLLYHESATSISGPTSKIRNELQALEATDNDFDGLCAEYAGQALSAVKALYAQGDHWMTAKDCKDFGFVDTVI
jgi:ATP-dependent Clp protease, protease subunit